MFAGLFMTRCISYFATMPGRGCSRQRDVSPLSYFGPTRLLSLPVIENFQMNAVNPFASTRIHMEEIISNRTRTEILCCPSVLWMMSSLDRCVECFICFLGLVILTLTLCVWKMCLSLTDCFSSLWVSSGFRLQSKTFSIKLVLQIEREPGGMT